jgi:hypothetical protein
VNGNSNDAGLFTVGPLPAGEYKLQAQSLFGHANSEPLIVRAGDAGVVLRLQAGGIIRGRVVDAAGKARPANIAVANEGKGSVGSRTSTRDGNLQFKGLLEGTYSVSATTSDGLSGRRSGIVVAPGATVDGIEVVLTPGARLSVRYGGKTRVAFEVLQDGVTFTGDQSVPDSPTVIVVPAGELEIRWYGRYPEVIHSERVSVTPGEMREVVWDGK